MGWRLGKAQELLHHLLTDGFDVIAEPGICQTVDAYREAGINFPGQVSTYNNHWPEGSVALFPPGPSLKSLSRHRPLRTLELTGWAISAAPPRRHRPADATLPFSDHADYNDLLSYIKTTNPRQVYTVNGHPHLAAHLRATGYPAVHLDGKGPHGAPGGFQMPLMQV